MTASEWITELELIPHPEGGFYRETYRSDVTLAADALPPGFEGERQVCTAIYYLLEGAAVSRLHRIRSDEIWHFHAGSPLTVVQFRPDSGIQLNRLSACGTPGTCPQLVVPAGTDFGAALEAGEGYALVSCTVSPGFDFADFEWTDCARLRESHPEGIKWIDRLS